MQDFQGIGPTGRIPSDADIAAGPNHVIQIVNSSFAVYAKCGQLLHQETFADFMGDYTSEKLFDPKVIWDVWSDAG
jgi:hypothetical protein